MFVVMSYAGGRRYVFVEGHSRREAAEVFGMNRDTVRKMCLYSAPPGYRRTKPPTKPELGALMLIIDAILAADREAPGNQQHTVKRIFERLRDEHGYTDGYTMVKDLVRLCRARGGEPLCGWHTRRGKRRSTSAKRSLSACRCRSPMPVSSRHIGARRPRRSSTGTCRHLRSSKACRCPFSTTTRPSRWRRSVATERQRAVLFGKYRVSHAVQRPQQTWRGQFGRTECR